MTASYVIEDEAYYHLTPDQALDQYGRDVADAACSQCGMCGVADAPHVPVYGEDIYDLGAICAACEREDLGL
jgi:hypothetical protein